MTCILHDWQELDTMIVCRKCGMTKPIFKRELRKFKWSDPRWCPQCGKVVIGGCPHCN